MPHDFPELVHALSRGAAAGSAAVVCILAWRYFRGSPLLPRPSGVADVPLSTWLYGAGIFGFFAALAAVASLPSFAVFLGILALLYAAGSLYHLRKHR